MGVLSIHQEDLEDHDSQGPSLPFEKALASIRRGGVLWFQSWNSESTQRMCYNGHLLYPLRKALTSNRRGGVVVSITECYVHDHMISRGENLP